MTAWLYTWLVSMTTRVGEKSPTQDTLRRHLSTSPFLDNCHILLMYKYDKQLMTRLALQEKLTRRGYILKNTTRLYCLYSRLARKPPYLVPVSYNIASCLSYVRVVHNIYTQKKAAVACARTNTRTKTSAHQALSSPSIYRHFCREYQAPGTKK